MKVWAWPAERGPVEKFFGKAEEGSSQVDGAVAEIIAQVRREGDRAVAQLTAKFDGAKIKAGDFYVPPAKLKEAWDATPAPLRAALKRAKKRIEAFHKTQRLKGWTINEKGFGRLTQRVIPLQRVAVYAPGGKAAYPSTVLMDVVPAKVAGVEQIVLMTPPGKDGWPDPRTLAAAWCAGVDCVLRIGGAQAVAAVAYGTQSIPRVDKVVGPGNIYVATAKKMLYGQIDIDSIAGPSEVLILADKTARLDWVAADMLAQAEHDQQASSGVVLIGGGQARVKQLLAELDKQLAELPRREIAAQSLRDNGYIITVTKAADAIEIANRKAPEHLEIVTQNARAMAGQVRNAGAIFVGPWTPEALGDYVAGPNHTLPTGGTARFFSPLNVWAFYKTSHTIEATRKGMAALAADVECLAQAEGLTAHGRTATLRKLG